VYTDLLVAITAGVGFADREDGRTLLRAGDAAEGLRIATSSFSAADDNVVDSILTVTRTEKDPFTGDE
jgi:hypothetical protein